MLRRSKGIIGLDIGSRCIKVVQLKESKGGYQLERLGIATLPPDLIVDGYIIDSPRVVETIKGLISEAGIKVKDVTIGVSGHSSVIIKRVSLPQMSEEELRESIKFEAEQYIPFGIEDVNIDFQILGQKTEENQMDVIIVAAKKDKIGEYVSTVRGAGLNPQIVDVDAFALENMYEINYEVKAEENVAIVNVGASMINTNILRGGTSVFTRDSSVGSNLHTEALQRRFAVSYEDAESLKRGEALEGVSEEDAASVLNSTSEDIIAEILRSFEYFRGGTKDGDIHKIILSGGGVLVKDFVSLLSERSDINVGIVEPFRNIRIPESFDRDYIKTVEPLMAVATGLALRRVWDR